MKPITLLSFLFYYHCIFSTFQTSLVSAKCLEEQQSLLLQLKNNLIFHPENSTKLILWNKSIACCNWSGVTCDNEGHVIGLDLSEEIIYGGFNDSSSLFSLQHLQKLNLAYNNFNSSIPSGFRKLEKLTYLNLSEGSFVGQIPIDISQLTRLVTLDLSFYPDSITPPLKLKIPNLQKLIQNLTNIRKLYLDGISITSRGYEWSNALLPLRDLQALSMSDCSLSGVFPHSIGNMTNLFHLDFSYNDLSGAIPSYIFTLPALKWISLASNNFNKFDEFINVSSSVLEYLDLHKNNISGHFPTPIFQLHSLSSLDLSYNRLNGSLQLDELLKLRNLTRLYLSYNNLSVDVNDANADKTAFPNIERLYLASCNLQTFPIFLMNQSTLKYLDLSANRIQGVVPNWIWKLQSLKRLNISHNFLTELEGSLQNLTSNVVIIDLHNNQLQGSIPVFPKSVRYLDYSTNQFSVIPHDIGNYLSSAYILSLSNNNLQGSIPVSLCNASKLQVLDISFNNISGTILPCLMTMTGTLEALNLRKNNLIGPIPDMFPTPCVVSTLNFHGNLLHGPIPKSLSYCSSLKVLDIGSNQISGGFPCFLENIPTLSILVLRNNRFHGSLECSLSLTNKPWKMIQIVDIAFNNFSGKLPGTYFTTWERMMNDDDVSDFIHIGDQGTMSYYQDSVTVSNKGLQMELVKILTIFTSIDFSSNHFEGPIPEVLMNFKALYVLNLSNNALYGEIPSNVGSLKQLESLDLSNNSFVGEIPAQLASLPFLSYLNLSFNHLVGKIPTGTQLQSFEASSFEGNDGLYGPPLTERPNVKRQDEPHPQPACERLTHSIDWNFLSVELGFIFGIGIIIVPILILKKWRVSYWKLVDNILFWIFPGDAF